MRRLFVIRLIHRTLFTAGIVALLWVCGQLGYAKTYQLYLMSKLKAQPAFANGLTDASLKSSARLRSGDLVGRLDIVERKLSVIVLEGVEDDTLGIAAGHVPGTSLPVPTETSSYRAPRHVLPDTPEYPCRDTIRLSTPGGTFQYRVSNTEIVNPSETRVLTSSGHAELTLITCYPFSFLGTAPQRFIVHARPDARQSGNE
jgi:LPXTG-site transpeptidase (sortase) family protein